MKMFSTMWPFKTDPVKQKQIQFRILESDFGESPEYLNMMKATWLSTRGNSLEKHGKLDEAIRDFEEAIRLKSDHLPSYFSLASAYRNKGMAGIGQLFLDAAPQNMTVNGEIVATKEDLLKSVS